MINPYWLEKKETVREKLRQPYIVLENALEIDVAERLYTELSEYNAWNYQDQSTLDKEQVAYQEVHAPGYTFKRHSLQLGVDELPPTLESFHRYLKSDTVRSWMTEVSGRQCDDFEGSAAMLKEGGHIADHNDYGIYKEPDGTTITRTLTFNYYLTKNWNPEWGGNFIWNKPCAKITPAFNTLVMFLVGQNSEHSVEAVKSEALEKRIAITGWYRTIRKATQIKKLKL